MFNLDYHDDLKHSEIEELQIDQICRICLNKKEEIFSILDNGLIDLLTKCTFIEITDEDGIYLICNECANEIKQCHNFLQLVTNSQKIGRYLIRKKMLNETESQNEEIDTNSKVEEVSMAGEIVDKKFKCPICVKTFGTKTLLNIHARRHDELKHYSCVICDKKYHSTERLVEHMRNHTGERPYQCAHCLKTFTRKLLLGLHIRNVHNDNKQHPCEICGKRMVSPFKLKMHMRTHSGETPYACDQCDKSFTTKAILKTHIKCKHTLTKDFLCAICGKAFNVKSTLEEHTKIHTGAIKETRHVCEICGKKFPTASSLKVHIRATHTNERPYRCEVCNKTFVTKTNLNIHIRTHTGEKPCICEVCGKGFGERSTLRRHERTHRGEKPYQCAECGKAFGQRSSLKAHLKVHEQLAMILSKFNGA